MNWRGEHRVLGGGAEYDAGEVSQRAAGKGHAHKPNTEAILERDNTKAHDC